MVFWKLYFIFGQEEVTPSDARPINHSVTLNSIRLNHNILFDNGTNLIMITWSYLSDVTLSAILDGSHYQKSQNNYNGPMVQNSDLPQTLSTTKFGSIFNLNMLLGILAVIFWMAAIT